MRMRRLAPLPLLAMAITGAVDRKGPPSPMAPAPQRGVERGNAWAQASRPARVHLGMALIAFPLKDVAMPLTIEDVVLDNGRSLVSNAAYADKPALSANGLTISRVKASCYKCVVLARDSSRTIIRDALFTGRGNEKYAVGIQLAGTAHDILIERVELANFTSTEPAGYPNADGLSSEKGNYDIIIRDSFSHDNTDGCWDMKSRTTRLENVWAARCGRNYRLWANITASVLHSDNPRGSHIWVAKGAAPVIDKLVATGGGLLAQVEDGGKLTIKSCDLTGWTGPKKFIGTVEAGPGC